MSLVLKKKGAKSRSFAPKIPQKRPGVSSTQTSARPSVERQSHTPAPHSHLSETVTIVDDEVTPEPVDHPFSSVDSTPPIPVLESPKDALLHSHSSIETSTRNPRKKLVLTPEKGGLKRKTREQDAAVEAPSKRHQHSGLDAPNSPIQPASPIERLQVSETRSEIEPQFTSLPTQESTNPETQRTDTSPSRQAVTPVTEANAAEESADVEFSQYTRQDSESTANASLRHPLPDNIQHGESGPEVVANGLGPAGDVGSARQLAQPPVIVPMAPLNPDGTPGELFQPPAPGTKTKVPKRRKVQQGEDGDDVRATVEMQLNRPRRAPGKKSARKRKDDGKTKSKRAETPEGAEDEEINKVEIKMLDITKDLRIGKKFSLHNELRQREKERIINAQLAKTHPELVPVVDGAADAESEAREEEAQGGAGLQMTVVDGQIVMNQNSVQLDRQKRAREEQGQVEEVTENDFSRMTTSGTHMKREKAQLWDMAANEIFWKGLRMFGTDFEMIAKMFPHRNRRQIKLKFNKEERHNSTKVDRILKGAGAAIELDTYEELSGMKLEDVEAIEAEREALDALHDAEEAQRLATHAEAEQKKKDAIEAARRVHGPAGDDGGSGENEKQSGSFGIQPESEKTLLTSKKASRAKRNGVKKPLKRPAADETVQVLGDA